MGKRKRESSKKWKKVDLCDPKLFLNCSESGLLSLEVLEDPSEVISNSKSDKPLKKRVKIQPTQKQQEKKELVEEDGKINVNSKEEKIEQLPKEVENLTQNWQEFNLHPLILKGIAEKQFHEPTPIQRASLISAIRDRKDIIGAAQTGSGKTLAFGIPILHRLLELPNQFKKERYLKALILTPTRELAVQISDHLNQIAKFTDLKIVYIIGGMAQQKQQRIIKSKPDVLVATPGRLWELICDNSCDNFIRDFSKVQFLVLDEADRMVETGHFQELHSIISLLPKKLENSAKKQEIVSRQTFVFSATLALKPEQTMIRKNKKIEQKTSIAKLIEEIDFQQKIEFIDLTVKEILVETLSEAKIECLLEDKDYYLYYLLELHKGRTLIFVNAISSIRRLIPLLNLLGISAHKLHAGMEQKQRLKNLERFRSEENGVLVATDVAARGLDIPNIDYVIHFQLSRSTELYVHRSGRTARAQKVGQTILLVGPQDKQYYTKLCSNLGKKQDIPNFSLDTTYLKEVKKRVDLAKQIESMNFQIQKENMSNHWLKKTAEEMDIEMEDDFLPSQQETKNTKQIKQKIRILNEELLNLLKHSLFSKQNILNKMLSSLN